MISAIAANLGRLARRPVLNTGAIVFIAIVFFAGTFGYHVTADGAGWYSLVAISVLTTAIAMVTLLLVSLVLDQLPWKSAVLVLLGVLVVAVVRAVVSSFVGRLLGLQLPNDWFFSLITSVMITCLLLIAIGVVSAYFRVARQQTAQLIAERNQIERKQKQLDAANELGRAAMASLISDVALPAITQSKAALDSARSAGQVDTGSLMALAGQIRDKSETEIRQLSHTLSDSASPAPQLVPGVDSPAAPQVPALTWWRWVRSAWLTCRIHPLATGVVFAALMLPIFMGQESRGMGTVSLVLSCCMILVALYLGSGLLWLVRRWGALPLSPVAISVTFLVAGLGASLFSGDVPTTWTTPDWFVPMLVTTTVVTTGWGMSLVFAADREQKLTQREIAAQTAARKLYVARLEHLLLATQKAAASILHTRVQGRFIAAAMTVGRAAKINAGDDADSVRQRLESLQAAIDILQQTADEIEALQAADTVQSTQLDAALRAVARSWAGVLDVQVEVTVAAGRDADLRAGMTEWITDVAREAISNAARHGTARRVWISVDSDGSWVRIQADNDGLPVASKNHTPGLEAARTVKAGGTWSIDSFDGAVRLVVELPLQPAEDSLRVA